MPILLKDINKKKNQSYICCRQTNKTLKYDRTLNLFALFPTVKSASQFSTSRSRVSPAPDGRTAYPAAPPERSRHSGHPAWPRALDDAVAKLVLRILKACVFSFILFTLKPWSLYI